MRILSAHNIDHRFNLVSKRATSVPEQCTNYCRNAQTECQQNPLTPALCETGSNFLDQYNFCQSCIEDNTTNLDLVKTSLLMRYIRCVGYCKVQEGGTPLVGGAQTGGLVTGQDGGPSTTVEAIVTTKGAGTSSSLIHAVVTMAASASANKGQRTMVTSALPAPTKPVGQPTNNPLSPTTSLFTSQALFTSPSPSQSASTSTPLTNLVSTQTLTLPTDSTTTLLTVPSTSHPNSFSTNPTTTTRATAPWVWAIVYITIVVVFLLSCGSFFVFYKRGRSKRARARQRGMKGMVGLKETAMHGFVDSRSTSRTRALGEIGGIGGIEGMAELDDGIERAELDQSTGIVRDVYRVGRQRGVMGYGIEGVEVGRGEVGRGEGGMMVLPVELPSVSGCVELPTSFNEREREEEEDTTKEGWERAKKS